MTNASIQDCLRETPLFREFTDSELSTFVDLVDPINFGAGECVVRQDDPGDSMYMLLSGKARVVHHQGGRDVELAVLKAGDFFGELALVDQGPRSADVETVEPCTLISLSQAAISALAGVYPTAAFKLLIAVGRLMVERLRKSNQRYVDSMLFPLQGKD
jgi:CRP-like cAMP-binding protein